MDFEAKGFPLAWRPLGVLRIRALFRPFVLKVLRRSLLILGTVPGVYTGMSFWNSYIGRVDWAAEGLNEPILWAADMGYNREGSGITEPRWIDKSTWSRGWKRWQFTDHGRVPGVPGACDLNFERS